MRCKSCGEDREFYYYRLHHADGTSGEDVYCGSCMLGMLAANGRVEELTKDLTRGS